VGLMSLLVYHMNGAYHEIGCVMLIVTVQTARTSLTVVRHFISTAKEILI